MKTHTFSILNECSLLRHAVFKLQPNLTEQSIARHLQCDSLQMAKQVHGSEIIAIDTPVDFLECDAMSTSVPKLGLILKHADCQAAIIYDPIRKALSLVHSGWRGSVQNIYSNAIRHMRERYHSSPTDLLVAISPSLGPESAEFIHYREELPEAFWDYQTKPNYFDFWQISRDQLEREGVLSHHIEIAQIDTMQDLEYHSYRREKVIKRNYTAAVIQTKTKLY